MSDIASPTSIDIDNVSVTAVSGTSEEHDVSAAPVKTISVSDLESAVSESIRNIQTIQEDASEEVERVIGQAQEAAEGAVEDAKEAVEGAVEDAKEAAEGAVEEATEELKEKVEEAIVDAVDKVVDNEIVKAVVEGTVDDVVDKVFDELVSQLNVKVGPLEINAQNLMSITKFGMEVVEASSLKGKEQKEMVLRLLEHVIREAPISDEREKLCLDMLHEGIIANTIDITIDATQGKININNITQDVAEEVIDNAVDNAIELAVSSGCC